MTGYASENYYLHWLLELLKGNPVPGGSGSGGDLSLADGMPTTDNGPAWETSYGVASKQVSSADMSGAYVNITDAPSAGQCLVITDILVSVDTAMQVDFAVETWGTIIATLHMGENQTMQFTPRGKFKLTTPNVRLQAITGAAGNISILTFYYSEA